MAWHTVLYASRKTITIPVVGKPSWMAGSGGRKSVKLSREPYYNEPSPWQDNQPAVSLLPTIGKFAMYVLPCLAALLLVASHVGCREYRLPMLIASSHGSGRRR